MADALTVAEMLARIDEAWSGLWLRVERTSDDQLLRSIGSEEGWPLSVVLAHISHWEEWHRDAVEQHVADGSVKSYEGWNEWNAGWAKEDHALAPADARRNLRDTHEVFRSALGALQPEQWDDAVMGWAQQCTYKHYEEHLGDFATPSD